MAIYDLDAVCVRCGEYYADYVIQAVLRCDQKIFYFEYTSEIPGMLFILALQATSIAVVLSADSTSLYQYTTSDAAANYNYPEGSIEYHCFDSSTGVKSYVRGTYGYVGYFEGAVDPNNPQAFLVDWWDTTTTDDGLLPNSGSAVLTYDATFASVQGTYWSAGTSDILNSYGPWSAQDGAVIADDSSASGQSQILQKCLYAGASVAVPRDSIAALTATTAISGESEQGQNVYCAMPAGPAAGPWLASYYYVYGDDDGGTTEKGTHGTDSITFWAASGMGQTTTWNAATGVYAGDMGTGIYMITATTTATYIVGFYCYINDDYVRTSCDTESYTVNGVNENAENCPSFYKLSGSLDDLYNFASTGSDLSHNDKHVVPTAMAILFGCLSGVLLVVVIYQCVAAKKSEGPLSKRDGANAQL
jgi:hypothetical protein